MIVPLIAEVDWVPRMAGIFYSLAIFMWIFVILNVAPVTQGLRIGAVCCVITNVYALVCNVLVVINALVTDVSYLVVYWEQTIGYILSGGAVVGWASSAMRQAALPNLRVLFPTFMIAGVAYVGLGVVLAMRLMSH